MSRAREEGLGTWTRRDFLLLSAMAGAGTLVPARAATAASGRPLGVAVVGLGDTGLSYVAALGRIPGVEMVALCDPQASALTRGLRHAVGGCPAAVRNIRELLGDRRIDTVVLAVPMAARERLATAACKEGHHVFVERPGFVNLDQGRRLVRAAASSHRLVCESSRVILAADPDEARRLLEDGTDDLNKARIVHRIAPDDCRPPAGILDDLVEEIDLARCLLGVDLPDRISAVRSPPSFPAAAVFRIGLRFPSEEGAGLRSLEVEVLRRSPPGATRPWLDEGASVVELIGGRHHLILTATPRSPGAHDDLATFMAALGGGIPVRRPIADMLASFTVARLAAAAVDSGRNITSIPISGELKQ